MSWPQLPTSCLEPIKVTQTFKIGDKFVTLEVTENSLALKIEGYGSEIYDVRTESQVVRVELEGIPTVAVWADSSSLSTTAFISLSKAAIRAY